MSIKKNASDMPVDVPGAPAAAAEQQDTSAEAAAVSGGDEGGRDASFSAVGFSYGAEGSEAGAAIETDLGEYGDGTAHDPGFPVPAHLSPLLRGVTERSHNVRAPISWPNRSDARPACACMWQCITAGTRVPEAAFITCSCRRSAAFENIIT